MKKAVIRLLIISFIVLFIAAFSLTKDLAASVKTQGYISIAFDDGLQNQYDTAYPLMHARGIPATFYVISGNINQSGCMTVAELQTLQANGNEIGSHSVTHPVFASLTDAQVQTELQQSKQTLQSYGLTINNFAYPYGGGTNHTDAMAAEYYRTARTTYAGPYKMQFPITQFILTGFPGETGDSTALANLDGMVDQIYSSNTWTIMVFHNVIQNATGNVDAISISDFTSFLNYIQTKGVATVTVNQALNLGAPAYTSPSIAINPSSLNLRLGQSMMFNSTVSGGAPPYTYRWYVNNSLVSSSNGVSYNFSPSAAGAYNICLNITDSTNIVSQSNLVAAQVNQYQLLMSTNFGTVSPPTGSYNISSTISIAVTTPVSALGERYIWLGWTGTGNGSYTGLNNTAQITMNGQITETAQWGHQYQVALGVSGLSSDALGTVLTEGGLNTTISGLPANMWVASGSSLSFAFTPTISSNTAGKQFVLPSVNGSSPLIAQGPTTVLAVYKTQYYLTIISPYNTASGSGWYDAGTSATAILNSTTVAVSSGEQYGFVGWTGNASGTLQQSDPIVMNQPETATANWNTQYPVVFNVSGINPDFSGDALIVNGTSYSQAGFQIWANKGDVYTFSYLPQLLVNSNSIQYLLTGINGNNTASAISVSGAINVSGNYVTQYYLSITAADGSSSELSGWYYNGTSVTDSVTPIISTGFLTQIVCTGWLGTGSIPALGNSASVTFAISAPSSINWNWKNQYLVSLNISPLGAATTNPSGQTIWVDSGALPLSVSPSAGYKFSFWSTDSINIGIKNNNTSTTAIVNGPGAITVNLESISTSTDITIPTQATTTQTEATITSPQASATSSNSSNPSTNSTIESHTPIPTSTQNENPTRTASPKTTTTPQDLSSNSKGERTVSPFIYSLIAIIVTAGLIVPLTITNKRKKSVKKQISIPFFKRTTHSS